MYVCMICMQACIHVHVQICEHMCECSAHPLCEHTCIGLRLT